MKKRICLFQAFKRKMAVIPEGVGDCSICTPDEKNKECKDFIGMTLYSFQAESEVEKCIASIIPAE